MALVQRPVGGLIALASEHLRSPAQLQGRAVGITGRALRSGGARHRGAPRRREPGEGARRDRRLQRRAGAARRARGGVHRLRARRRRAASKWKAIRSHPSGWTATAAPPTPGWSRSPTARSRARTRRWCATSSPPRCAATRTRCATPPARWASCCAPTPSLPRALTAASLRAYLPLFDAGGRAVRDDPAGAHRRTVALDARQPPQLGAASRSRATAATPSCLDRNVHRCIM